jgi:hypothetical protein
MVALLIAPTANRALADSCIDSDTSLLNFLLMIYLHEFLHIQQALDFHLGQPNV